MTLKLRAATNEENGGYSPSASEAATTQNPNIANPLICAKPYRLVQSALAARGYVQ